MPAVLSAMFVEAITWWFDHGRPGRSAREFATRTAQFAAAMIGAAQTLPAQVTQ